MPTTESGDTQSMTWVPMNAMPRKAVGEAKKLDMSTSVQPSWSFEDACDDTARKL